MNASMRANTTFITTCCHDRCGSNIHPERLKHRQHIKLTRDVHQSQLQVADDGDNSVKWADVPLLALRSCWELLCLPRGRHQFTPTTHEPEAWIGTPLSLSQSKSAASDLV